MSDECAKLGVRPEDLLPREFSPSGLEEELRAVVVQDYLDLRRDAVRLRREHPGAGLTAWIDLLFQPFLRGAMTVSLGAAAVEVVPLSLLFEGPARVARTRSLLGRQVELIAAACLLLDDAMHPDDITGEVLAVLSQVYGLETIRDDLEQRDLWGELKAAGPREAALGAARLVLRSAAAAVEAGRSMLVAYGRYSRFRELRQVLSERLEEPLEQGEDGPRAAPGEHEV